MTTYAALLGAITIDASNKAIRFKEGLVTQTVSLVEGVYFARGDGAADDLHLAAKTALETNTNAVGPNTYTVSHALSINPAAPAAVTSIARATGSSTFQILWADALTTFKPAWLGFTAVDTAEDALTKVSSRSPSSMWISSDIPESYEPADEYDVSVRRARSGRVRALRRGGTYDVRTVLFRFIDSRRALSSANTADPDATFSRFLRLNGDGKHFEFHGQTVSGTTLGALSSSTRIGTAWHFDEETASGFAPDRVERGLALYDFDVGLMGYVS